MYSVLGEPPRLVLQESQGAVGDRAGRRACLLRRLLLLSCVPVNGTDCVPGSVESASHTCFCHIFSRSL